MPKLTPNYYQHTDVVFLAQNLLGKVLCSHLNGQYTSGIICETEAYAGVSDKASHAYGNKRTTRTESMYLEGGHSYVYLCYGIHHLFNVVCNKKDVPHAILIRGILPKEGIHTILKRRNKSKLTADCCIGPGKVSQALGIKTIHDKISLQSELIWIEDIGLQVPKKSIQTGPRVGIDYAAEDALLPYRFQCTDFKD